MLEHERVDEAKRVLLRALATSPKDLDFIAGSLQQLKEAGYREAALELLQTAVEQNPEARQIEERLGLSGPSASELFAQDEAEPAPENPEMPMYQFSGFCAVCNEQTVTSQSVGVLARSFSSESSGSWTLDYLFNSPLSGSTERTDQIVKLTERINCE